LDPVELWEDDIGITRAGVLKIRDNNKKKKEKKPTHQKTTTPPMGENKTG